MAMTTATPEEHQSEQVIDHAHLRFTCNAYQIVATSVADPFQCVHLRVRRLVSSSQIF